MAGIACCHSVFFLKLTVDDWRKIILSKARGVRLILKLSTCKTLIFGSLNYLCMTIFINPILQNS